MEQLVIIIINSYYFISIIYNGFKRPSLIAKGVCFLIQYIYLICDFKGRGPKSQDDQIHKQKNQYLLISTPILIITHIHMKGDQLLLEWKQAKETCQKIIEISIASNLYAESLGKQSGQEFMKVYDVVYRLCSNRQTQETRVGMVYRDYKDMLKGALMKLSKQLHKERDLCKLKILKKIWDAYEDIIKRLKHMFAYLNRPFHIKQGKIEDLDRTGMILIVQTFFNEECLLEFETIYFKSLNKMRESKQFTDSHTLKDYVDILYRIHLRLVKKQNKRVRTVYTDFQQKYLTEARQSYKHYYTTLKQFSPSEYFIEANDIFTRERKLVDECFGIGSQNLINKVFSEQFLQEYRDKLISNHNGLKSILQNRESETIKVITELYKKLTNSIDGFKQPFETFIYDEFSILLQQSRTELSLMNSKTIKTHYYISLIKTIIERSKELMDILKTSFMKYNQFISYYKNGIERSFSKNTLYPQIEEMLAIYVESQMKINYQSQDELLESIKNILSVFECIENKDLFLLKYLQKLCKNIIVMSIEALSNHEAFVYGLKMHSGIRVTQKLETIIDEYKLSLEEDKIGMMKQNEEITFKQITKDKKLPYAMNIRIFSEGVWPYSDIVTLNLDRFSNMLYNGANCIKLYQEAVLQKKVLKLSLLDSRIRWMYYFERKQQQQNRKLPQSCYIDTNAVQGLLLSYIYERRPQKVSLNLLESVFPQIKPELLQKNIKKMEVNAETQIIIRQKIEDHVYFFFNKNMRTKKKIINYDITTVEEIESQKLFQKNELGRDREFTIDANIAKLMKSKKILSYERLTEEVIKMIKVFTPTLKDLKTSVQRLIQKDILERDAKDKSLIRYKD